MKKYELGIVINGKLSKDECVQVIDKVKSHIIKFNGKINSVDDWGKRRLVYEIQKIREGYYYFISFEAEISVPTLIEKQIRIIEEMLRFLIVKDEA